MDNNSADSAISNFERHKICEKSYGALHIFCYEYTGMKWIILWNKFTVLVKQYNNLNDTQAMHYPDIIIKNVFFIENIFLCIDAQNVLHFTVLRHHEHDKKLLERLKFKPILKGICCLTYNCSEIFVLLKHSDDFQLYIYGIIGTSKMKLRTTIKMEYDDNFSRVRFTSQIFAKNLRYFSIDFMQLVLHIDTATANLDSQIIFIVNHDIVYWTLPENENKGTLSILYACPAAIKTINFADELCSKIYISLITGSMMVLTCDFLEKSADIETVHLNTSLERVLNLNDSVVYSNGTELWHTRFELTHEKPTVKHRLLKILMPFDFTYDPKDCIVYCTTLHNTLYSFRLDSDECFATKVIGEKDDFISVPKSLNTSKHILDLIIAEHKINEGVLKSINEENNMITAIALNRKSNLILEHLFTSVQIYKSAHDILKEDDVICVSNTKHYYDNETQIYVIKFEILPDFKDKFNEMIKTNDKIWHLNVQLRSKTRNICCSIELRNPNCIKLALPVTKEDLNTKITASVKLIALIPGAHQKHHHFWCVLPSKTIKVNSSYNLDSSVEHNILKRYYTQHTAHHTEHCILRIAHKNCSTICSIEKQTDNMHGFKFSYYINLFKSFQNSIEQFTERFTQNLNPEQSKRLASKFISNDFKVSQKEVKISVLSNSLQVSIDTTDSHKSRLKVVGSDVETSWDVYSFALDILQQMCKDEVADSTVPHFDFMILQNLREVVSSIITSNDEPNLETLINVAEEFRRDILGILPI